MRLEAAREIIACLPKGKTPFYYFKDRYAPLLLKLGASSCRNKKALRNTRFSRLLDKAIVRETLAQARGRELVPEDFDAIWPTRYETYFLTLGTWGGRSRDWQQTSRPGFNLVLQLNFSSEHDEPYRRLVHGAEYRPFEFSCHPVAGGRFHTLAWSRLDIDLARGEALIEEIQNDWLREAAWARRMATMGNGARADRDDRNIIRYVDSILRKHEAIWHEAMLAASLWFLVEELGVRNIYYHTYDSGIRLKSMASSRPPRSLYTRLPRRFCFSESSAAPAFLNYRPTTRSARAKRAEPRFYSLEM